MDVEMVLLSPRQMGAEAPPGPGIWWLFFGEEQGRAVLVIPFRRGIKGPDSGTGGTECSVCAVTVARQTGDKGGLVLLGKVAQGPHVTYPRDRRVGGLQAPRRGEEALRVP